MVPCAFGDAACSALIELDVSLAARDAGPWRIDVYMTQGVAVILWSLVSPSRYEASIILVDLLVS